MALLWTWLLAAPAGATALPETPACAPRILKAQAAPELAADAARPAEGWVTVRLPDHWAHRWPDHQGAVWYRIDWTRDCDGFIGPPAHVGLSIAGISMAGEVYSNDEVLWRDVSLAEPLSMSWNMPRWWLLPESTLREGVNTIWVRSIGSVDLMPGLGNLHLGPVAQVEAIHAEHVWRQRTVYYISLGLSGALGGVFLVVWCLRRRETAFGWYAATSLCWVVYVLTMLATTPWPMADTVSFSRLNNVAFVLYVVSFCRFTWGFGAQRLPRAQRLLWLAAATGVMISLFAPRWAVAAVWIVFSLTFLVNCAQFPFHAWRTRHPQHALLAACCLTFCLVGAHDMLMLLDGWRAHDMWGAVTSLVTAIVMAFLLGGRLVVYMQRVEGFNRELEHRVNLARAELATVLEREHRQALTHATLQQRLQIVHDLHDGLGGSLVRGMALMEQTAVPVSHDRMLSLLKVLRDDLRQVIDQGSSAGATVPATPAQWAAPLRHRFTRLFDELDIRISWVIAPAWRAVPTALLCLGMTRLVEEALSNVIKHSRARNVAVTLTQAADGALELVIEDDGAGFDVQAVRSAGLSVGMRSMTARAERMNGTLQVDSGPGGTRVRVVVPMVALATGTAMAQTREITPVG
ncbi:sensor histidine kinase [Verticiella alkaliphila]|uniref:sensor histidine kinase n=1 Tax=Verticiella alkaliphila TaxID=2779529 RepID=UPI0035303D2E